MMVVRCFGAPDRTAEPQGCALGGFAVRFTKMLLGRCAIWSIDGPLMRAMVIAATIRERIIAQPEYPLEIIVDFELAERRVATGVLCLRPIVGLSGLGMQLRGSVRQCAHAIFVAMHVLHD